MKVFLILYLHVACRQTGSGKTYTMRSMIKQGAADIFRYIDQTPDREFLLRISAVEIYNEKVSSLCTAGAFLLASRDCFVFVTGAIGHR